MKIGIASLQQYRMRRNYQRDKAAGICVKCRKHAAQDTNVRCADCQAKHYAQKKRAKARKNGDVTVELEVTSA